MFSSLLLQSTIQQFFSCRCSSFFSPQNLHCCWNSWLLLVPSLQHHSVWLKIEGKAVCSQHRRDEMHHHLLKGRKARWYWCRNCEKLGKDIQCGPGSCLEGTYGFLFLGFFPQFLSNKSYRNFVNGSSTHLYISGVIKRYKEHLLPIIENCPKNWHESRREEKVLSIECSNWSCILKWKLNSKKRKSNNRLKRDCRKVSSIAFAPGM